ncbi:hypothetical protein ACYSNU_13000 [Enterococcus sp. LJL120]
MNQQQKSIICLLIFAPLWLLQYTILHEGGHALVMLAYGGTIDSFWIIGPSAHVSAYGASYTFIGEVLLQAAGMLLPSLVVLVALLLYRPKVAFAGYHLCYFVVAITPLYNLLVWVALPIASLLTVSAPEEDVTKFLILSGWPPLAVSLAAFVLMVGFAMLIHHKGVLANVVGILRAWRAQK